LRWLDGEAPFRPIILRGIILRGIILRRIVLRRIVVRSVRRTFGVLRIVRSVLRAFFLALLVSVGILVLVLVVLRSFDRSLGLLALVAVAVIGGSLGLRFFLGFGLRSRSRVRVLRLGLVGQLTASGELLDLLTLERLLHVVGPDLPREGRSDERRVGAGIEARCARADTDG